MRIKSLKMIKSSYVAYFLVGCFILMEAAAFVTLNSEVANENRIINRFEQEMIVSKEISEINLCYDKEVKLAEFILSHKNNSEKSNANESEFLEQRKQFAIHAENAQKIIKVMDTEKDSQWGNLLASLESISAEHQRISTGYLNEIKLNSQNASNNDGKLTDIDRDLTVRIDDFETELVDYVKHESSQYRAQVNANRLNMHVIIMSLFILLALSALIIIISRKSKLILEINGKRLQEALDQHAMVSMTTKSGDITYANKIFCTVSGYSLEELNGQNHRLLKSDINSPDLYHDMWKTIESGNIWRGNLCNRNKNGGLYWVYTTLVPFPDESGILGKYISIGTDITELVTAKQIIDQERMRLNTILDNLGEGIYMLDNQGLLTYINHEAEKMLGWSREELMGKRIHEIIHHHHPDGTFFPLDQCPIFVSMTENKIYRSNDELFFQKNGDPLYVKLTGAPLCSNGTVTGSVALFSDTRIEKQIKQHLIEAKEQAESATRLKSEFLSTMSHEIRTPLNGVIGMIDLLSDTSLDTEQVSYARTIRTSAYALLDIINDILDLSKFEAGQVELENEEFALRPLIESSLDIIASAAQAKNLTLACSIAPDIPEIVVGDAARIRQVLLNLLSNAVKFTETGEVQLKVECREKSADGLSLQIQVVDTGIGMTEQAMSRLFTPFSQGDSSITRRFGGTGLGLSITKHIVTAMKGTITAHSEPGKGSVFKCDILLSVGHWDDVSEPGLTGKMVWVTGDSVGARFLWCAALESWRMKCEMFDEFGDILSRLDGIDRAPDIVLLAEPLPGISLLDACAQLRAHPRGANVVLLAGVSTLNAKYNQEPGNLRIKFVGKPIKPSNLFDSIMSAMTTENPLPEQGRTSPLSQLKNQSSGKRILLAEDNAVNQMVITKILDKLGYSVDVVDNGRQAVEQDVDAYSLILMDCQMPEMDGFEATRAIREKLHNIRHIPIIAMTANALSGDREACLAAGMDDYVSKPVEIKVLSAVLERWSRFSAPVPGPDPAISASRLESLFGNDVESIQEILGLFANTLLRLKGQIECAIESHDKNLTALAHELEGASANIGADRLAKAAAELLLAARSQDQATLVLKEGKIQDEIREVLHYIEQRNP